MGKEKGFAMTSLKTREVRRWLERRGYAVEPGQPHLVGYGYPT